MTDLTKIGDDIADMSKTEQFNSKFHKYSPNQLRNMFYFYHKPEKHGALIPYLFWTPEPNEKGIDISIDMKKIIRHKGQAFFAYIIERDTQRTIHADSSPFTIMNKCLSNKVQIVMTPIDNVKSESKRKVVVDAQTKEKLKKKQIEYNTEVTEDWIYNNAPPQVITFIRDNEKYESRVEKGVITEPPQIGIEGFGTYEYDPIAVLASSMIASRYKLSQGKTVMNVVPTNLQTFYGKKYFKKDDGKIVGCINRIVQTLDNPPVDSTGLNFANVIYNIMSPDNLFLAGTIGELLTKNTYVAPLIKKQIFQVTNQQHGMYFTPKEIKSKRAIMREIVHTAPMLRHWTDVNGNIYLDFLKREVNISVNDMYAMLDNARNARLEGDKGLSDITHGYPYGMVGMPRKMVGMGALDTQMEQFDFRGYKKVFLKMDSKESTHVLVQQIMKQNKSAVIKNVGKMHTGDVTSGTLHMGDMEVGEIIKKATKNDIIIITDTTNLKAGATPQDEQRVKKKIKQYAMMLKMLEQSDISFIVQGYYYPEYHRAYNGLLLMKGLECHNLRIIISNLAIKNDIDYYNQFTNDSAKNLQEIAEYGLFANYARNEGHLGNVFHAVLRHFNRAPPPYKTILPEYVGYAGAMAMSDVMNTMPSELIEDFLLQFDDQVKLVSKTLVPKSQNSNNSGDSSDLESSDEETEQEESSEDNFQASLDLMAAKKKAQIQAQPKKMPLKKNKKEETSTESSAESEEVLIKKKKKKK